MPPSVHAFVFIIMAVVVVHFLIGRNLANLLGQHSYQKLLTTYVLVLLTAATSPSYWIFLAIVLLYIIFSYKKTYSIERLGAFILLMLALPNFAQEIPGIGGIRFIMNMTYSRFLILALLLPLLLTKEHVQRAPFRLIGTDIIISAYIILIGALGFRHNTFTNATREFLMLYIDIFLPYYVFSRYVTNIDQFRRLLAIFVFGICILSLVSLLETTKYWHLYTEFSQRLGTWNTPPIYLLRSGMLRASTVFFTPIALGLATTMAFGAYLYLRPNIQQSLMTRIAIPMLLIVGLASSLSRGPWLGFVLLLVTFTYLQRNAIQKTIKYLFITISTLPVLSLTPYWGKIISLMPFIGNVETENITYRQRLIDNAILVIQKYPLFGSTNYIDEPEMQQMIQGQGIVDVVNSYIGVALSSGIVGLFLFVAIFLSLMLPVYRLTRLYHHHDEEYFRLGISILSTMLAILFTISTVSSIDYIPYLYWTWAGLLGAYIILACSTRPDIVTKGQNAVKTVSPS